MRTIVIHKGHNYRIKCPDCGYDKVSSTDWGAEQARSNHFYDEGHRAKIIDLNDK